MKALNILATVTLLTGCITGNPWQQFMLNSESSWKNKTFSVVTNELEKYGHKRITPEGGYALPNGNQQHEFLWRTYDKSWSKDEKSTCYIIFEVNPKTNKVVAVGGKGGTYACAWGG